MIFDFKKGFDKGAEFDYVVSSPNLISCVQMEDGALRIILPGDSKGKKGQTIILTAK